MNTFLKVLASPFVMVFGTIAVVLVATTTFVGLTIGCSLSIIGVVLVPFIAILYVFIVAGSPFMSIAILFGWRPQYLIRLIEMAKENRFND